MPRQMKVQRNDPKKDEKSGNGTKTVDTCKIDEIFKKKHQASRKSLVFACRDYSATVPRLFRDCSATVLRLFRDCSATVLRLFCDCSATVLWRLRRLGVENSKLSLVPLKKEHFWRKWLFVGVFETFGWVYAWKPFFLALRAVWVGILPFNAVDLCILPGMTVFFTDSHSHGPEACSLRIFGIVLGCFKYFDWVQSGHCILRDVMFVNLSPGGWCDTCSSC